MCCVLDSFFSSSALCAMDSEEAKLLVKAFKEEDAGIFNVSFGRLKDMVPLARGNFGQVFKAVYKKNKVAVKKLLDVHDENMQKYLMREVFNLKALSHPNVVSFVGLCKHHSGLYIVTEFVEGSTLRKILKDSSIPLSWSRRLFLALQIAVAMEYLHSKSIIHRDLKSHNVLVRPLLPLSSLFRPLSFFSFLFPLLQRLCCPFLCSSSPPPVSCGPPNTHPACTSPHSHVLTSCAGHKGLSCKGLRPWIQQIDANRRLSSLTLWYGRMDGPRDPHGRRLQRDCRCLFVRHGACGAHHT